MFFSVLLMCVFVNNNNNTNNKPVKAYLFINNQDNNYILSVLSFISFVFTIMIQIVTASPSLFHYLLNYCDSFDDGRKLSNIYVLPLIVRSIYKKIYERLVTRTHRTQVEMKKVKSHTD